MILSPDSKTGVVRCLAAAASAFALAVSVGGLPVQAQTPPNKSDIREYKGLLSSVVRRDLEETQRLLAAGADPNIADASGRTPLIVAAHWGLKDIARALVKGGADARAKDKQHYDIITIAAVNNDAGFLKLAFELGADPKAITSPYDGTALIAAAHLGHDRIVAELIMAGAPLDHVNNLGMTALIEAIVLGDGGGRSSGDGAAAGRCGGQPEPCGSQRYVAASTRAGAWVHGDGGNDREGRRQMKGMSCEW